MLKYTISSLLMLAVFFLPQTAQAKHHHGDKKDWHKGENRMIVYKPVINNTNNGDNNGVGNGNGNKTPPTPLPPLPPEDPKHNNK